MHKAVRCRPRKSTAVGSQHGACNVLTDRAGRATKLKPPPGVERVVQRVSYIPRTRQWADYGICSDYLTDSMAASTGRIPLRLPHFQGHSRDGAIASFGVDSTHSA